MTTGNVQNVVKSHRKSAMYGGAVGVGLVVCLIGWKAYDQFSAMPAPAIHTASPAAIVEFVSDERGLARMPRAEQQHLLQQWKEALRDDEKRSTELAEYLEKCEPGRRQAFADALTRNLKDTFLDDAKRYDGLRDSQARYAFLREKQMQYATDAAFIKRLGRAFKNEFSASPEETQAWVMAHTTPEERQLGEPYLEALKRMKEQVKKEERATTSGPGAGAGPS